MVPTRYGRASAACRAGLLAVLLIGTITGCACRPGYVGPYGGIHPTRCWVW